MMTTGWTKPRTRLGAVASRSSCTTFMTASSVALGTAIALRRRLVAGHDARSSERAAQCASSRTCARDERLWPETHTLPLPAAKRRVTRTAPNRWPVLSSLVATHAPTAQSVTAAASWSRRGRDQTTIVSPSCGDTATTSLPFLSLFVPRWWWYASQYADAARTTFWPRTPTTRSGCLS